jgi:serine/threonine protein kinase
VLETTIAGKYRMVRLLGEGGMGAVYEAEHTSTGRRLAVKLITAHAGPQKKEAVTRFEREARMAGTLDTEHIVQVIDSGEDAGLGMPFMVMELLQGEDVQGLLDRVGPLPPELALRIAAQACVGLRQAHQANIIHRDIKPANVFLAQRDEGRVVVKILDFGIAKMRLDDGPDSDAGKLTRTGTMVGSPYFMSPEQALGEKDIDFRSDVWSLGVVLYTTLTGRTPHENLQALGQVIMAICSRAATPVQELAPWVAPEVAAVVHKALMIDRHKRFASMSEMLEALRALLPRGVEITQGMLGPLAPELRAKVAPRLAASDLDLASTVPARSARSESRMRRAASDTMSSSTSGRDIPVPGARPKRLVVLGAAAAAVAVAVAGIVGYSAMRPSAPPLTPGADARPVVSEPVRSAPGPVVEPAPGSTAAVRSVTLAIAPGTADVDVDGKRAVVKDGKVELGGALGSVHKVRVALGTQAEERDVVIAESGPVPSKIEIVPRSSGVRLPGTAAPSATIATPAEVPSKTVKPKPASTVDKNFDQ